MQVSPSGILPTSHACACRLPHGLPSLRVCPLMLVLEVQPRTPVHSSYVFLLPDEPLCHSAVLGHMWADPSTLLSQSAVNICIFCMHTWGRRPVTPMCLLTVGDNGLLPQGGGVPACAHSGFSMFSPALHQSVFCIFTISVGMWWYLIGDVHVHFISLDFHFCDD